MDDRWKQKSSAGELRNRITIQHNETAEVTDSNGLTIETWTTLFTLWAKKSIVKTTQFAQAASVHSEMEWVFRIRYQSGIKAGMRIIEGTEMYEITSPPIDREGRRAWLEIHAREVELNGN